MRALRLASVASLLLAAALPLPACHHHHGGGGPSGPEVVVRDHGGPPPHAPAHGYRHKHKTPDGTINLIFDSGLGVYVVVGWPDHYWHRDHYLRYVEGSWMTSRQIDGGWVTCGSGSVPSGLVQKHARAEQKRGRWSHPAKHGE